MTDTERLDFLLSYFTCDDVGDESVVLELTPDASIQDGLFPVDPDRHHMVGSWMDGWTCDKRAVIDAAIERSKR